MDKTLVDSALAWAGVPISVIVSLAFVYGTYWIIRKGVTVVENNTTASINLVNAFKGMESNVDKQNALLTSFGRELTIHAAKTEHLSNDVQEIKQDVRGVQKNVAVMQIDIKSIQSKLGRSIE